MKDRISEVLYQSAGYIAFFNKDDEAGAGSGILISSNLILTAAESIFGYKNKCEYSGFKFSFGENGKAS